MAVDHDRARELHACSLRALMENPPKWNASGQDMADWIDAVLTAWERQEQR